MPASGTKLKHFRISILLLSLVLVGLAWAGPAKTPPEQPETVVAIGDVHGDFEDFVTILQRSGLIDAAMLYL